MKTTDSWIKLTRTTGIGSLPHHNADTALDFSFKMGIPFLPQIPIRNPWEFMIAQAIEGLPGLQIETEGTVSLDIEIWKSQSHSLANRLEKAFSQQFDQKDSFQEFEPRASTSSCWEPFLWELQERNIKIAKIQIAGPLTTQWAIRLKDGSIPDQNPELSTQIFQLLLARSLAMVNRMNSCGIQPILFIDEPGLYALSLTHPKHLIGLQELKLMIQTLHKAGALIGLHCCSNTLWDSILELGMDFLSIDAKLSLHHALATKEGKSLENFIVGGGRLSLGIVPTPLTSPILDTQSLLGDLMTTMMRYWEGKRELMQKVLRESLYTPACGLALQSTSEVEIILDQLTEVYEYFHA